MKGQDAAEKLGELAAWCLDHPDLDLCLNQVQVSCHTKVAFGKIARVFGTFEKVPHAHYMYLYHELVPGLQLWCAHIRDEVCTRRQIGTQTVVHEAQPATPARTEQVPIYEWDCGSILQATQQKESNVT